MTKKAVVDDENMGLNEAQVAYITNKVKELGNYGEVSKFYNRDVVGTVARKIASKMYGEEQEEDWVIEALAKAEKKSAKKKTTKKVAKKRATMVKKKRKIDVDDVLNN